MALRVSSLDEALAHSREGRRFAAGRTVLRPGAAEEEQLIDISRLPGLDRIEDKGDSLRIGALVTLERLRTDPLVKARNPVLCGLLGYVGGLGVRTLATIGGNLGWGAGDLVPLLLAHGATLETSAGPCQPHQAPPAALVEAVLLPAEPPLAFAEKVGYRAAFSPPLLTVAFGARRVGRGLVDVRIAAGGGATPPQRLPKAEAMVTTAGIGGIDALALAATIRSELRTNSDAFASAAHRADLAGRVVAGRLVEALA